MIHSLSKKRIKETLCKTLGLSLSVLTSGLRTPNYVQGRIIYALIRKNQFLTNKEIVKELKRPNHSMVTHWLTKHEEYMDTKDPDHLKALDKVCTALGIKMYELENYKVQKATVLEQVEGLRLEMTHLQNLLGKLESTLGME